MATSGDSHAGRELLVHPPSQLPLTTETTFTAGGNRDIQSLSTDSLLMQKRRQILVSSDGSRDTPGRTLSDSQPFCSSEALRSKVFPQSRRMSDSYLNKPPMCRTGSRCEQRPPPPPSPAAIYSTVLTPQLDISTNPDQEDDILQNVTWQKSSSLSRYKPLPAIKPKSATPTAKDVHVIPTDSSDSISLKRKPLNLDSTDTAVNIDTGLVQDKGSFQLYRNENRYFDTVLDQSPSWRGFPLNLHFEENDGLFSTSQLISDTESPDSETSTALVATPECAEQNILLAVKLPNSQRIQRCFHPEETFRAVRQFAELESGENLSDYQLVCNMPRVLLSLDTTIRENGLLDKTLLHLEHSRTFTDCNLQL